MSYKEREQFFNLTKYKSDSVELEMLQHMHPALVLMIAYTNLWCYTNKVEPVWTSWMRSKEQNEALGATDVHLYRAADLSLKKEHGWTIAKRTHFERDFRSLFKSVGAFSYDSRGALKRVPIVRHDSGHGDHYHIQVAPNADVDDLREMRATGIRQAREKRNKRERDGRAANKDS